MSRSIRLLAVAGVMLVVVLGGAVTYLGQAQPPTVTMVHHVITPVGGGEAANAGVTLPDVPGTGH
ncbi:hypothetical protein GS501_03245 [Saccharibacter sp. 17.LH.SD]|uniref:hypothetical protein n=1 Tax=Saccharibacter sp. 17.LH.SD TaxID=2689393 RepID=UPI0013711055|nr:hypothetical protein [Saccharibacter sp. 17.LH.SD]MXV44070.1 hypothetical protein [Saccharibacter sp. 17.LH.SD]